MQILIVTQYYYPEQFQINYIAPELMKRGHEVTVLCGVPNYPQGVVFEGYETKEKLEIREREYYEKTGVRVVHVKQVPRGRNPVSLVSNYMSFVWNSRKVISSKLSNHKFDIVLGYQLSPITSMLPALQIKRQLGVPVLFYTLDIWPESALGMLKTRKNPLYPFILRISRKIYQSADRIMVTSRPFIDYLHRVADVPIERLGYLPQHADESMLNMDLSKLNKENMASRQRESFPGSNRMNFMFAGNLGKGQWVDVIIKAAHVLGPKEDYKIHLVGDGSMRVKLERMVQEYGLEDNVIFYGNQKREMMPAFYSMSDVLLITLRGNNEVGNTMPGKLQMYMTAGKPIIGAINGAAYELIQEASCGSCVTAGDYQGLAQLMRFYIEHPESLNKQGENARKYFREHFTLDIFMNSLEAELRSVLQA